VLSRALLKLKRDFTFFIVPRTMFSLLERLSYGIEGERYEQEREEAHNSF